MYIQCISLDITDTKEETVEWMSQENAICHIPHSQRQYLSYGCLTYPNIFMKKQTGKEENCRNNNVSNNLISAIDGVDRMPIKRSTSLELEIPPSPPLRQKNMEPVAGSIF